MTKSSTKAATPPTATTTAKKGGDGDGGGGRRHAARHGGPIVAAATTVSLFPRRPPPVVRVRRWVTRDKAVVHVLLGAASCPEPVRRLLLRVADDDTHRRRLASPEKSSPAERAMLARAFGPQYVYVLALREPRVRYVFDAALFPDSTIREALHVVSRVAFEGDGQTTGRGAPLSDIYAWSETSTSPSAQMRLARTTAASGAASVQKNGDQEEEEEEEEEKEGEGGAETADALARAARGADATWTARLLDALFSRAGGVTIKTTDLLRSIAGLRSGRVASGGSHEELLARHFPSSTAAVTGPALPRYLTRMHAAKLVKNLGGIARVTRSLSSSSPALFGRADPVAMLKTLVEAPTAAASAHGAREQSLLAAGSAALGRFMAPVGGELLRTFVEEDANGVMATEIQTVSREDFGIMARRAAAEARHRVSPPPLRKGGEDAFDNGVGVAEQLVADYFPSSVGAATMHTTERDGGEEVRRMVAQEHAAIARAEERSERVRARVDTHVQNTRYKAIHLSNGVDAKDAVSSGNNGLIDLDAVFALVHTNAEMQLMMFFNGVHSVYKVNRMALHRHHIDVSWVLRNIGQINVGKNRKASQQKPFIAFVLNRNDESGGSSASAVGQGKKRRELLRVLLFEDRHIEMRRFAEAGDEDDHQVVVPKSSAAGGDAAAAPEAVGCSDGLTDALADSVAAINRLVLAPLNDKYIGESGGRMATAAAKESRDAGRGARRGETPLPPDKRGITTAAWVGGVLPFAPLDPYALANGPYSSARVSRMDTTTRVWVAPPHAPASIREVARALNSDDLSPYVSAAVVQSNNNGGGASVRSHDAAVAIFRRCERCASSNVSWVAAWQGLQRARREGLLPPASSSSSSSGDEDDDQALIERLARTFAATRAEAQRRVSTMGEEIRRYPILHTVQYKVETVPLQAQVVPRVAVIEREPGAYSIETYHIFDPLQIEVAIRVAHHALCVAVSNKDDSRASASSPQEGKDDGGGGGAEEEDLLERALRQQEAQDKAVGSGALLPPQAVKNDNDDNSGDGGRFDTLEALKRADRHLFDSPVRSAKYASTCQKSRQPVVVSARELEAIPADRYDGPALAVGSTPEHARRNRYICPQVWCPQSRMPMTVQQYEAAGRRCPGSDRFGEEAILFDQTYWKDGRAHYVNLLPRGKHPHGMCMPCCSLKPPKPEELEGCPNMEAAPSSSGTPEEEEEEEKEEVREGTTTKKAAVGQEQIRYIKGNVPGSPLEKGRFGLLPTAMMHMFNSSSRRHKHNKRAAPASSSAVPGCGSRPDGTGHITVDTNCFVRRGVPHHAQRFLQCMATVLDAPQGAGTPDALVSLIVDRLSVRDYLAVDGGKLCRMFMSDNMISSHHQPPRRAALDLVSFAQWFVADAEYHATFPGLVDVARRVGDALNAGRRQQQHRRAAASMSTTPSSPLWELFVKDACVAREYDIYRSLQHFRSYMLDPDVIKTHGLLLDLFNMPLPWLNPRGVNIIVLESDVIAAASTPTTAAMMMSGGGGGVSGVSAAATVQCSVPRRLRLSSPLAFVCAQGPFYEPIVRVGLKQRSKNALVMERQFRYDRHPRARAVVDALMSTCRLLGHHRGEEREEEEEEEGRRGAAAIAPSGGDVPPTVSNIMRFLSTVFGRGSGGVRAQVIDYTFRLVGLVTNKDVFVPLYSPNDASPPMLVGADAPAEVYYIRDVVRAVRPHARSHVVVDMFDRLAAVTNVPDYAVDRVLHEGGGKKKGRGERLPVAAVLRGGALVPLAPVFASAAGGRDDAVAQLVREHDGEYLEELNIMVLRGSRDEPRARYTRRLSREKQGREQEHREVAAKLQEDTRAFIEFHFLRSSFNPFPLEFRRHRMRLVLERMLAASSSAVLASPNLPALVDEMLYGEDPLLQRSLLQDRYSKERHTALRNSPMRVDFVFDDMDVVRSTVPRWLNEIAITPYAMPVSSSSRTIDVSAELRAAARDSVLSGKCGPPAAAVRDIGGEDAESDAESDSMAAFRSSSTSQNRQPFSSLSLSSMAARGGIEDRALWLLLNMNEDVVASRLTTMDTSSSSAAPPSATISLAASGSGSLRARTLSQRARRRHDHRIPHIVHGCDLWRTFALVARLTSFSSPGRELPRGAFLHVLRNTLHRDLRRYVSDPRQANDIKFALSSHPTLKEGFARVAEAVNDTGRATTGKGKGGRGLDHTGSAAAAPERLAELLALLDSPGYVPGLYDVRVLARFCGVSCAVIDADNMRRGVIWKEKRNVVVPADAPPSSSSSSSSSTVASSSSSRAVVEGAPLLVLIYTPSRASFDVVMFRSPRTDEYALLLYPEDPGYERELMNIAVAPEDGDGSGTTAARRDDK